jgi:hypothetical protein
MRFPSRVLRTLVVLVLFALAIGPASAQEAPEGPEVAACLPGGGYASGCDVDQDGDIDIFDIQRTAGRWGSSGAYTAGHTHWGETWTTRGRLATACGWSIRPAAASPTASTRQSASERRHRSLRPFYRKPAAAWRSMGAATAWAATASTAQRPRAAARTPWLSIGYGASSGGNAGLFQVQRPGRPLC